MCRWLTMMRRVTIGVGVLAFLAPTFVQATLNDARARAGLAGVRVPFIVNHGQTDARVAFYAPTFAGTLFVTKKGALVYSLPGVTADAPRGRRQTSAIPGWALTERLRDGRARPVGQEPSATGVSYFLGNDPARWRPAVPTYDQLSLGEVWPGVTVSLRASGRSVEKVFTVKPGGSVARIRVRLGGASTLAVDREGALIARTGLGPVTFTAPVAYQEHNGVRRPVAVTYRITGREYGFTVAAYDPALPLVIDPLLQSTYLGGSSVDQINALAVHPTTGDVYVAGQTSSNNFPHVSGGIEAPFSGGLDMVVARLNGSLTSLIQATYLGGTNNDAANALAIHPATGDVYIAGSTSSTNIPLGTPGPQLIPGGAGEAYVARLTSSLTSLTRGTFLGGSDNDGAFAIAIHPATGDVYVAGITSSTNFPNTGGSAQPAIGGGIADAFVVRYPSSLATLTQATYLGGSGGDGARALAIHPTTGDVYVAGTTDSTNLTGTSGGAQPTNGGGQDVFVARLSSSLASVTQATYLGGNKDDTAMALAIHHTTGDVYVAGFTLSTNFPHTGGGAQSASGGDFDGFVARLPGALTSVTQATYLGGSGEDFALALAIHPTTEDVYVAGQTRSTNFPHTNGGVQPAIGGDVFDAFVARLTSSLASLIQTTYLGGSDFDEVRALAIHPATGDVYVAGDTSSTDFPHPAGGAQQTIGGSSDAFVSRLTFSLAQVDPTLSVTASVNQSSFAAGQTLTAGGSVTDPGLPFFADFYAGIVRPDGSVQLFTSAGIVLGNVNNLATFQPLAVNVPLGTSFSVTASTFYQQKWAAADLHGSYTFFVAAVKTGALTSGPLTSDKILAIAAAPFTLQ